MQLYLHNSWKKWAANKANKLGKVVLCTIKIISNLKQTSLLPVILGQLLSCFGAIAFALKLLRKGQANNLGKLESFIKLHVVKTYFEFKTNVINLPIYIPGIIFWDSCHPISVQLHLHNLREKWATNRGNNLDSGEGFWRPSIYYLIPRDVCADPHTKAISRHISKWGQTHN